LKIDHYRTSVVFDEEVTTEQIIGALQQIVERAHMHGVNVLGGTQPPFESAAYYSEKGKEMLQAANQWLRKSGQLDAVGDFDAITRDPNNPKRLRPCIQRSPSPASQAMAGAIDLLFFRL